MGSDLREQSSHRPTSEHYEWLLEQRAKGQRSERLRSNPEEFNRVACLVIDWCASYPRPTIRQMAEWTGRSVSTIHRIVQEFCPE